REGLIVGSSDLTFAREGSRMARFRPFRFLPEFDRVSLDQNVQARKCCLGRPLPIYGGNMKEDSEKTENSFLTGGETNRRRFIRTMGLGFGAALVLNGVSPNVLAVSRSVQTI